MKDYKNNNSYKDETNDEKTLDASKTYSRQ